MGLQKLGPEFHFKFFFRCKGWINPITVNHSTSITRHTIHLIDPSNLITPPGVKMGIMISRYQAAEGATVTVLVEITSVTKKQVIVTTY